jgi:hypothetical protein
MMRASPHDLLGIYNVIDPNSEARLRFAAANERPSESNYWLERVGLENKRFRLGVVNIQEAKDEAGIRHARRGHFQMVNDFLDPAGQFVSTPEDSYTVVNSLLFYEGRQYGYGGLTDETLSGNGAKFAFEDKTTATWEGNLYEPVMPGSKTHGSNLAAEVFGSLCGHAARLCVIMNQHCDSTGYFIYPTATPSGNSSSSDAPSPEIYCSPMRVSPNGDFLKILALMVLTCVEPVSADFYMSPERKAKKTKVESGEPSSKKTGQPYMYYNDGSPDDADGCFFDTSSDDDEMPCPSWQVGRPGSIPENIDMRALSGARADHDMEIRNTSDGNL